MIIPVWQKIGESTHLLAQRVGKKTAQKTKNPNNLKATHTGTLDPMAKGVVVVLTGEDRYKKAEFSSWKKTYQFEILFGVSTDSLDLLGLVTKIIDQKKCNELQKNNLNKLAEKLKKKIDNFIGLQTQTQPKFSSQRIEGQSGFDLAKINKQFTAKENEIEIYSLKILNQQNTKITKIKKEVLEKLSHITGDFRQDEIKLKWEQTFSKLEELRVETLPIFMLEADVSKRTYIRALVRDITKELKLPAATFSIIRTRNGKFNKKDC